jgi:hypothetical protein
MCESEGDREFFIARFGLQRVAEDVSGVLEISHVLQ